MVKKTAQKKRKLVKAFYLVEATQFAGGYVAYMNNLMDSMTEAMAIDGAQGDTFEWTWGGGDGVVTPIQLTLDAMDNFFRAIDQVNELHKKSHLARLERFFLSWRGSRWRCGAFPLSHEPTTSESQHPSLLLSSFLRLERRWWPTIHF